MVIELCLICLCLDLEGLLSRVTISTARLARKQLNFRCAEELLIDEIQRSIR